MKAREKMSKFSSKLAVLLFVFLLFQTAVSAANYTISDYNIDINVTDKRIYEVNENIKVWFNSESHGIFRSIPEQSSVENYLIKNVSTGDDESSQSSEDGNLTIKIGDPDTTITGEKDYNISYDLVHIKDDAADGDYFYMNLIGTEWSTDIAKASVTITFPTDQLSDISLTSGKYNSSSNALGVSYTQDGNKLYLQCSDIGENEGITLKLKMPEGTFANAPDEFYPFLKPAMAILSVLSILVLLISAVTFFKYGKDKPILPVTEFYPPDNMSPAQIGYVIDRSADDKDVTSLILYWASKGYLTFTRLKGNNYQLTKKRDLDNTRPKYEHDAFNKLWACGSGGTVTNSQLENNYYTSVQAVASAIPLEFINSKSLDDESCTEKSFLIMVLTVASILLPVLVSGIMEGGFISAIMTFLIAAAFAAVPPVIYYFILKKTDDSKHKKSGLKRLSGTFLLAVISLIFVIFSAVVMSISTIFTVGFNVLVTLTVYISTIFAVFTNKRTDYGQNILERTIGFREFLLTAEKDKLEMLLDENPEYFYNILPYAIALDVTDKWASKFNDLVKEPPSWYNDSSMSTFNTTMLCHNMSSFMRHMQNDMTSSPSSSDDSGSGSFGGGGFSGGGSGGGGGGSW